MDIDNSLYTSIKYILGALLSAIVSLCTWNYKRNASKIDSLHKVTTDLHMNYHVVHTEIQGMKDDIIEIKEDLKKLLFK